VFDFVIVVLYLGAVVGSFYVAIFKLRPWLHAWLDRHLPK
jgi:hypothetical protein